MAKGAGIAALEAQIKSQGEEISNYQSSMIDLNMQVQPTLDILDMDIEMLNLSLRVWNCLTRAGIKTVKDILNHNDLTKIKNLVTRSVQEVHDQIKILYKRHETEFLKSIIFNNISNVYMKFIF